MKWRLHPLSELLEMGDLWDSINARCANLPVLDFSFFRMLFGLKGTSDATLAVCDDGGEPVAAGIFIKSHLGFWHTYQPSQAPLGAWIQRDSQEIQPLLESLQSTLPGPSVLLSVTQLDPSMVPRPQTGGKLTTVDYFETARLQLEGTFDDYWRSRSQNLKKNLKRQRNRLAREGVEPTFEIKREPVDVGSAIDDYGRLESNGWKAKEGTALHPENHQGRFYRELMESYAARGEALVYRYLYNEELAACDFYLVRDGVPMLLKTTYDERQTTTSPSSLLRTEIIRTFFEEGFSRVEFQGRRMEWHSKWTDDFRVLFHVNLYGSGLAMKLAEVKKRVTTARR